jgi:copper homeostasis protein
VYADRDGRGTHAARAVAAVEICATSLDEALAAEAGGARRIELCVALEVDGLTPPAPLLAAVRERLTIPVFALVRPRAGSFAYDADELEAMRRDAASLRVLGADGIVTGALTRDGRVDGAAMRVLLDAARPLPVTFHRALDAARDPLEGLDVLLAMGVDRVLSSGAAPTAREGAATLAEMVRRAGDALAVMAGGRVRADHAGWLVRETGVREIHAHLGADAKAVAGVVGAVA